MKAIKAAKKGECQHIKEGKPPYTLRRHGESAFKKSIFVLATR